MAFIPHTEEEKKLMLERIGVDSFEDLIAAIPQEIRLKQPLNLNDRLSEFEVVKLMDKYSSMNSTPSTHTCFIGGGAYDHFIPSVVGMVLSRSEFKTAYTPYQAEVSQGTLQAMYEFQSMICALTGMDVANASLYDGGTALAEACLMSQAHNRKSEFLIAGTINPYYLETIKTITSGRNINFKTFIGEDGTADLEALKSAISNSTSAVIVQHPNFYGNLEEVEEIEKIAHEAKALLIASSCPFSMGILKTPGEYNADIIVGEGQPLGIPLSYGGPYLGIFAAKNEFVRKLPGRLAGVSVDTQGRRCFVLTLQTREQQIKREKATSNICTNQGLFMLAATVYMETLGKQGVAEVAQQSYEKAVYLADKISGLPGYSILNDKPFFREFVINTPVEPELIIAEGHSKGFLAGLNTGKFEGYKKGLLVAVTEKRSKEEMDAFVDFLRGFCP